MRQDETLKKRLRVLRANLTPAEAKLWAILRGHRFGDVKFTRQTAYGPYIVDFAARSRKLVIEIDGDTHGVQVEYDARRTAFLEQQGFRVIRFTNADVMGNMEGVLEVIAGALASRSAPLPGPLPAGGEREG